ncbi:YscQ/HrcQ family type III secretion apparatus protein, partial [Xanthomonas perforans]
MTRVAAERAQLGRVFGDPRAARQCGFATHCRRIWPNDAARLRLQLDAGQMELRIAARDGLALLLNEDDDALRVSIAGMLLADRLGAFAPLGLGAAEVIAFERDAEPDDCHGIGMTLGDLDAIALTASAPLLATLQAAVGGLAPPAQQPAWLA